MLNLKRFFRVDKPVFDFWHLIYKFSYLSVFALIAVAAFRVGGDFAAHYGAEQAGYYEGSEGQKDAFNKKMATGKYRVLSMQMTDANSKYGDKYEYTLIKVRP